jgi:hypothetical protein
MPLCLKVCLNQNISINIVRTNKQFVNIKDSLVIFLFEYSFLKIMSKTNSNKKGMLIVKIADKSNVIPLIKTKKSSSVFMP